MSSNCASGCSAPGSHSSWGECVRSKGLVIGYCQSAKGLDATTQKNWDKELAAYKSARAEGIQPSGTKMADVERAKAISDKTGSAYQAS